jgi:hypothetical protein
MVAAAPSLTPITILKGATDLRSDTTDLAEHAKSLRVFVPDAVTGGVGTVKLTPIGRDAGEDDITLTFPPGLWTEPVTARRVWATGTSSDIEIHGY